MMKKQHLSLITMQSFTKHTHKRFLNTHKRFSNTHKRFSKITPQKTTLFNRIQLWFLRRRRNITTHQKLAFYSTSVTTEKKVERIVRVQPACLKFSDNGYIKSLAYPKKKLETFYKKPLPTHLVDFSSDEGKLLFRDSFQEGFMESYFLLSPYYVMQSEPAFCGLATLSMALNSLHIDPARVWKGPWRWYQESSFNCCFPLKSAREKGISIQTFSFLAQSNGAQIKTFYASESDEEMFRKAVKEVTSSRDSRLIVSYDRGALGQTGSGHFSPIGGYNQSNDLVLVIDVAQFKYPPHWVPVSLLFKAMQNVDVFTGKSRGYFIMHKGLEKQGYTAHHRH